MSCGSLRVLLAVALTGCIAGSVLRASDCTKTSVGLTPLPDLGTGTYQGEEGGLYPGGTSARPAGHDADLARVGPPVPLDPAGNPDPANGLIGFISCGMSNANQEFGAFKALADAYPAKNPKVVIVNCAFPGKTAEIIRNPADPYWTNCDNLVNAAGLTLAQVQVVWLKEADANPASGWPAYAQALRDEMGDILQVLKGRYPNTRSVYLSSRIYAGYASTALNPEPYAYESGFSVKWLVGEQLAGDPRFNFDPARGAVLAPWIAWGPYLWADGLVPRSDGLAWECNDLGADGTHPSPSGEDKVADLLLDFFRSDPTTIPWFLACNGAPPAEVDGLRVRQGSMGTELSWTSQDPAAGAETVYDVASGPIATLHATGSFGGALCLGSDHPDTPWPDADGPVLHLRFDEGGGTTAADSSGNGNDGQVTNAAWSAGRLGGALQFNGTDSIVTVPSNASLSPATQITVALWARPDALTNGILASKWITASDETWMFRVRPDGILLVNIVPTRDDNTYSNAGGTSLPVMAEGAWHHVAFVYDGAQPSDAARLKIYVDGVSQPLTFSAGGIPAALTIGMAPVSAGCGPDGLRPYSGVLDDLRVYARALTDTQVAALAGITVPGRSIWYLVRARNSCAVGTWGAAELDAGALRCP